MLLGHLLGAEDRAKEDIEQQGSIGLGLFREGVLSLHYHQLLAQISDVLDHLEGVEVCLGTDVYVEDLLSVPDQPTEVDRQGNLLVCVRG